MDFRAVVGEIEDGDLGALVGEPGCKGMTELA